MPPGARLPRRGPRRPSPRQLTPLPLEWEVMAGGRSAESAVGQAAGSGPRASSSVTCSRHHVETTRGPGQHVRGELVPRQPCGALDLARVRIGPGVPHRPPARRGRGTAPTRRRRPSRRGRRSAAARAAGHAPRGRARHGRDGVRRPRRAPPAPGGRTRSWSRRPGTWPCRGRAGSRAASRRRRRGRRRTRGGAGCRRGGPSPSARCRWRGRRGHEDDELLRVGRVDPASAIPVTSPASRAR